MATILVTKGDDCCGDPDCPLPRCPVKNTLPAKEWDKPQYTPKPKTTHTQRTSTKNDDARDDNNESTREFSGLQTSVTDGKSNNEILDNDCTITLCTNQKSMGQVGPFWKNVIMETNSSKTWIDEEGSWKEYNKAYLCESIMTNTVGWSNAVRKDFWLYLDTNKENTFFVIKKETGKTVMVLCDQRGLHCQEDKPVMDCRTSSGLSSLWFCVTN